MKTMILALGGECSEFAAVVRFLHMRDGVWTQKDVPISRVVMVHPVVEIIRGRDY